MRDMLLGIPAREHDFLYIGSDQELKRAFPRARPAGKAFPIHVAGPLEFAPARGETLAEDLARRDLTINAMALEVPVPNREPEEPLAQASGLLHAHPQALDDLRQGVLRAASPTAMQDDPLRVFRAARFAAQLPEFLVHDELMDAMRRTAGLGLLEDISAERVGVEMRKALHAPKPGRFLEVLDQANCLSPWFQELAGARQVPAGPAPYHDGDVLAHVLEVMERIAGNPLVAYMALCHDLGKCATDPAIWPHHYEHEHRGADMAETLGHRLRLPMRWIRAGIDAAKLHMKAGKYGSLRPGTRVDLLMRLHAGKLTKEMFALARADSIHTPQDYTDQAMADLDRILAVDLPPHLRNMGEESGKKLRELRCMALASG